MFFPYVKRQILKKETLIRIFSAKNFRKLENNVISRSQNSKLKKKNPLLLKSRIKVIILKYIEFCIKDYIFAV